jgi:two-component system chemotaxis sensor kinase CheA
VSAEGTGGTDPDFVRDALPAFVAEASEQTDRIEQLLLELEDAPGDRALLDELFRCAHTVKGSAGIFGLDAVVGFTHHVETLLDAVRDGDVALTPALGTLLLRCTDRIRALVGAAQDGTQADGTQADGDDERALVDALREACAHRAASAPGSGAAPAADAAAPTAADARWRVSVAFGADTFRNGMDPLAIVSYLGRIGTVEGVECDVDAIPPLDAIEPDGCRLSMRITIAGADRSTIEAAFDFVREDCELSIEPDMHDTHDTHDAHDGPAVTAAAAVDPVPPLADGPARADDAARAAKPRDAAGETRVIRVQADRLDAVINLLGELVIAGAGASLLARQAGHGALIEANAQIARLVEEIRNGTLQLRMVPIGETFSRFRRVVRDTAAQLGKDVALEIRGGDTELDKSMVERIADPLMHLVRNALDHGLETPAERLAAGKPAQGTVTLSAWHESGSVMIRIADDGRGIRRAKVLERAWARGLVDPGTTPPDEDVLNLIFAPGFSTAETVTNLSGRGVGMDVVRSNIEALRGSVTVRSVEGEGSTIDIRLPLTLAIIDGFLVGIGASRFVFPLDAVVEVIERREAVGRVGAGGERVVEVRGRVLPVVDLRVLYDLEGPAPERSSIVVVQSPRGRYGVLADQLLGQHQTVIKPLGRLFRSLRGIAGSSILGNGEVALIVDPGALGELAAAPQRPAPAPAPASTSTSTPASA